MHEFLTRLLQFAQKMPQIVMHALQLCLETLAMASHRVSNLVRQYAPIIRQSCVINVRNAWQHALRLSRIYFNHAVQFMHRVIIMATAFGNRIAELLRYYAPIVRQFLISNSVQAGRNVVTFCRFCLERIERFLRRTVVLVTFFVQNTSAQLHHYLPIILQYLSSLSQSTWRTTGGFCRELLLHAINVTRNVVRGIVNTCVLIFRFLQAHTRNIALAVTAVWFRTVELVRHYQPIVFQAAGRGLQGTALALTSSGRWCTQVAGKTIRIIAAAISSLLARTANIILGLLLAIKNLLLFIAGAIITIIQIAGRHLAQGNLRFFHSSRIIAVHAGERLYQYALLARLHKPIGIYLLLWPTLWALCIAAGGVPDFPLLLIFTGGVVLMRSAGCIVNDLADQDFDAQISRTRLRPLAAGKVTPKEALVVATVLLLCAFLLVLQLNALTIGLSVIGALLAIVYPFTKRYTYMPQFFLGLTFGWAVPMAFAAQTGTIPVMAWVLLMATVLWALVYDTIYAMMDRAEDIKLGIKSTAILLDDMDRVIIGIIQGLVVLTLLLVGSRLEFNGYYYVSLAIAALLFIYQQYLIRERIPAQCFKAFLNNNWFGAIVFAGILMNYLMGPE